MGYRRCSGFYNGLSSALGEIAAVDHVHRHFIFNTRKIIHVAGQNVVLK